MRKILLAVAFLLALSACSAKSVEVATETTMDPTVTTEAPTTTVKTDRIYQCTEAMQLALPGIGSAMADGLFAYTSGKAGLAQAQDAAMVVALKTAERCQLLLPECTTPASQWVQDVKTYVESLAANFVRIDRGFSAIPTRKPDPVVDPTCV